MTDFVYDGTPLPTGKVDIRPVAGATNQYVSASDWNTSMQAMLDLRSALLNGQYHGVQSVYWQNASGVTQARSWYATAPNRHVLLGNSTGTTPWVYVTAADKMLHSDFGTMSPSMYWSNGSVGTDVVLKVGTSLTDASVNSTAKLLSVRTGISGSEVEYFWVSKNKATLDMAGAANSAGFTVSNVGGSSSGITITRSGNRSLNLNFGDMGAYGQSIYAANSSLDLWSTSSGSGKVRILTEQVGAGGAGLQIGTMTADGSVDATAKLLSVRTGIGGTEVEKSYIVKDGTAILTSNSIGFGEYIYNRAGGFFYYPSTTQLGIFNQGGSIFLGVNLGTGVASSSGTFQSGTGIFAAASTQAFVGYSTLGAGASDVCMKLGVSTADGSVDATAKLLSVRTGIGGTEVEKFYIDKSGDIWTGGGVAGQGIFRGAGNGNQFLQADTVNGVKGYVSGLTFSLTGSGFTAIAGGAGSARFDPSGRLDQSGSDSSGSPGNTTIDKPTGKSAVAGGASTIVVTNSLVAAGDIVILTPHENAGNNAEFRNYKVSTAAGSFTVTLSSSVTNSWPFCWEVKKRI